QLSLKSQLVKTAHKYQLASVLNGAGDSRKNGRDLLDSFVLRVIIGCIEVPRWIGIGQYLLAGAGNSMLLKGEVAIKIVCFFSIAKELVAPRRRDNEFRYIVIGFIRRFSGTMRDVFRVSVDQYSDRDFLGRKVVPHAIKGDGRRGRAFINA